MQVLIALMAVVVLAVVAQEEHGTYGYKITQEVRAVMVVSESTLYPVLRRLQKDGCLDTYDQEFAGRNRRYYRLTEAGRQRLADYRREWRDYRRSIDRLLLGEEENA